MFDAHSLLGQSWSDIPERDAGRIPFPQSKRGRYAIGERKTALVLLIGYTAYSSFEQDLRMLSSLSSVMQSHQNRLFVDVGLVIYRSEQTNMAGTVGTMGTLNTWKEEFTKANEDCRVFILQHSERVRSSKPLSQSLRESLLEELTKGQYEQVIMITVGKRLSLSHC